MTDEERPLVESGAPAEDVVFNERMGEIDSDDEEIKEDEDAS